jgi:putative addiction module CopG family antidote
MELSLSPDLEEYVASKITAGTYASREEVLVAGLKALRAEEHTLDQWLVEEVGPAYDEMQAHPERGIPLDKVFAGLRQHHEDRMKTLA